MYQINMQIGYIRVKGISVTQVIKNNKLLDNTQYWFSIDYQSAWVMKLLAIILLSCKIGVLWWLNCHRMFVLYVA